MAKVHQQVDFQISVPDQPGESAVAENRAIDVVEPDRLALGVEREEGIHCRSEVRGQGQRSEVRGQKPEVGGHLTAQSVAISQFAQAMRSSPLAGAPVAGISHMVSDSSGCESRRVRTSMRARSWL